MKRALLHFYLRGTLPLREENHALQYCYLHNQDPVPPRLLSLPEKGMIHRGEEAFWQGRSQFPRWGGFFRGHLEMGHTQTFEQNQDQSCLGAVIPAR